MAAQRAIHFERAGAVQRAIHCWQQTGENAARWNAHHEAIAALQKGLALLMTQPESPERAQRELTLQLTLGELRCQEALTLARQLEHAPSLALAGYYAAMLSQSGRNAEATYAHADTLMALATA